jgi:conjugal transfer/type IV secretion protein DotA/TraY
MANLPWSGLRAFRLTALARKAIAPLSLAFFAFGCRTAFAFKHEYMKPAPGSKQGDAASIFSDSGYGRKWIGDLFPYQLPRAGDVHAVLGEMLNIYNTGMLVLASIIALWSIVQYVAETAHSGEIGGKRHGSFYAPLRLVIAIGLLVPISHGYNTAQVIIVQLAHAGSGLANSVWKQFVPYAASNDFDLPLSRGDTTSDLLQKALIDETCLAAVALDKTPSTVGPPSVTVQAFYRDPDHPGHEIEGAENAFTLSAKDSGQDAMTMKQAVTTESDTMGLPVRRLRLHYNRAGFDDYCGAIDFPVPAVPVAASLISDQQTLYAEPYLDIRSKLGGYGQDMAAAVAAKMVPPPTPAGKAAAASTPPPTPPAPAVPGSAPATTASSNSPLAGKAAELPAASMSAQAWNEVVDDMETHMAAAAKQAGTSYIDPEATDHAAKTDTDWVTAFSLFFKLIKLSHDNVVLRFEPMSASLPDPAILPDEMRSDGRMQPCAPVLNNYFLADYNCRVDGEKTTIAIKVAYNLIHSIESQRGTDVVDAVDGALSASRKEATLSPKLFAEAGLDGVVTEIGRLTVHGDDQQHHSAMFDIVNVGNMLLLSTSGLFEQSALTGQMPGGMAQSMLLTLFAVLLIVPAIFLSIVLPILPAIRFVFGLAVWLLMIFEALVAFPLVVLGQLRSDGEGLLAHGRQGYLLVLQMMLRPVLMVFGLMAALVVFDALYWFVTWAIWSALLDIRNDSGQLMNNGIQGVLELTGYIYLWSGMIYMAANLSFRAINTIPDRLLEWIGMAGAPIVRATIENPVLPVGPQIPYRVDSETTARTQTVIEHERMTAHFAAGKEPTVTGELPPSSEDTKQRRRNSDNIPALKGP